MMYVSNFYPLESRRMQKNSCSLLSILSQFQGACGVVVGQTPLRPLVWDEAQQQEDVAGRAAGTQLSPLSWLRLDV